MINQTQNQQSFYTKPSNSGNVPSTPTPQPSVQQTMPQGSSKKTKSKSFKNVFAVVGLVLFLVIAMMGVLIAQRQVAQTDEDVKPVAPTAPESKPQAAEEDQYSCSTTFTVTGEGAICKNKVALTDFSADDGELVADDAVFNVGDEFVFKISAEQPSNGVAYNVVVEDTLPNSLEYVQAATSDEYTIDVDGQKITATIDEMGANSTVEVEFKVRVLNQTFGEQTNVAYVKSDDGDRNSCQETYTTVKGSVECESKEMYDSDGDLITSGKALTRGEEYEYRVNVNATNRTLGSVVVTDVIPAPLEFVDFTGESKDLEDAGLASYDTDTNTITANFKTLNNEPKSLTFTVKVPDEPGIKLGNLTNSAEISLLNEETSESETADSCEVTHTIVPVGTATCVEKEAFNDFNSTEITSGSNVDPSEEFIYRITVKADRTTTGPVVVSDKLPEDLSFIKDNQNTEGLTFNSTTREVSIDLGVLESGEEKIIEFKVQLIADPSNESFTNEAVVTTDGKNTHTCEIPLDVTPKEFKCDSSCENNDDCASIGDGDHICYPGTNTCRLESNPTDDDCEPAKTPTPTPTGSATPTPTPAPGCNDLCESNADCSNSDHICVTTATGENRCRLAEYTQSTTCTEPQPELPTTLPETGPEDWLNWLKAGLVTMGIGTALFLLL